MSSSPVMLKRIHVQRLSEVYQSAGWPYQDVVEIDLLAAGLLARVTTVRAMSWCSSLMQVSRV